MVSLAQQVKIIRVLHGLSQKELVTRLGIDRRDLSRFENGHTMLKDEEIQKIGCLFRELGVAPVLTIHLSDEFAIAA